MMFCMCLNLNIIVNSFPLVVLLFLKEFSFCKVLGFVFQKANVKRLKSVFENVEGESTKTDWIFLCDCCWKWNTRQVLQVQFTVKKVMLQTEVRWEKKISF